MLLTVTAAVPVCQKSEERTLGPGTSGTRRQIPAGSAHSSSGHAKRKVIKGECTPWENMLYTRENVTRKREQNTETTHVPIRSLRSFSF